MEFRTDKRCYRCISRKVSSLRQSAGDIFDWSQCSDILGLSLKSHTQSSVMNLSENVICCRRFLESAAVVITLCNFIANIIRNVSALHASRVQFESCANKTHSNSDI